MNKRMEYLIKKLHSIGVFYDEEGREIEELTLIDLEDLHITRMYEFVNIIRRQRKSQPAGNKLAFA